MRDKHFRQFKKNDNMRKATLFVNANMRKEDQNLKVNKTFAAQLSQMI